MNEVLQKCIDQIWFKYDDDNSGYLDREEARKFVIESVNKSDEDELNSNETFGSPKKLTLMEQEKKKEQDKMTD